MSLNTLGTQWPIIYLSEVSLHAKYLRCLNPPNVIDGDGIKPDGLTLVNWQTEKTLVWDFTCADTLAKSYVKESSRNPGFAAQKTTELRKHLYKHPEANFHFVPVCVETLDTWKRINTDQAHRQTHTNIVYLY